MGVNSVARAYNFFDRLKDQAVKAVCAIGLPAIPHRQDYRPFYSPWEAAPFRKQYDKLAGRTLVKPERCYRLLKFLEMTFALEGEIWECGTYRGGTARLISDDCVQNGINKTIRLFDTFGGMPETDPDRDLHRAGDFQDTSEASVREFVGNREHVKLHPGWVPQTFAGLEDTKISFAHIDLDIYQGIKSALEFIYPRLAVGGVIVFDDYGFPTCPGAKAAVDELLGDRVISLSQGQAVVIKNLPGSLLIPATVHEAQKQALR